MPPTTGAIRAGRAFVEVFADDSKLVRGMKAAEMHVRAFGLKVAQVGRGMMMLGAAVLTPLVASAKAFGSMGDSLGKMSKRTGVSVEALSELAYVAKQSGTNVEDLEVGLRGMQRTIYDAGRGLSTATDALADLGLTIADLKGLKPEDQLKLLADRLAKIEDPSLRAALAMKVFGRSGTQLLPLLQQGAAGIERFQREARDLHITMSTKDAEAAETFTDTISRLLWAVRMAAFHVGAALAPALSRAAQSITDVAGRATAWIKANQATIVSVLKVAAAVTAIGVALLAVGKIVAAVATAMAVLRGLWVALTFHPVVAGLATAAAVIALTLRAEAATWRLRDAVRQQGAAADETRAADLGRLDRLAKLASAERLSAAQSEEATALLAELGERYGDLGASVDRTSGKLVGFAQAQAKVTAAMREATQAQLDVEWLEIQQNIDRAMSRLTAKRSPLEVATGLDEDRIERARTDLELLNKQAEALVARERALRAGAAAGLVGEATGAAKMPSWAGLDEETATAAEKAAEARAEQTYHNRQLELELEYEGLELQERLLALERQRSLEKARAAGLDVGLLEREFDLRRSLLRVGAWDQEMGAAAAAAERGGEALTRASTRGTFYAFAVAGLDVTNDAAKRTAQATERTARNTDALLRRGALTFT